MGILASPGEAANSCEADADPTQGQNAAAGVVEDRQGGRVNRSSPGPSQRLSGSGVDEGEPPREDRPG